MCPWSRDSGARADQPDRVKLFQICSITNRAQRWRELPQVLDVDRFISFAAMEMLTAHWDGYVLHTNNYRLYCNPMSGQFVFLAHGMDWAFLRTNLSLAPPHKSIVSEAVLDTPEGQGRYRERVGALFTNVMRFPVISSRLDDELAKIRTGNFNSNELAKIEQGAALIRERVLAGLRARRMNWPASSRRQFLSTPMESLVLRTGALTTMAALARSTPDRRWQTNASHWRGRRL